MINSHFESILTKIYWTGGNKPVDEANRSSDIIKLFTIMVHESSNENHVLKQGHKLGLIDKNQVADLSAFFHQVNHSPELRDEILTHISNPDFLTDDLHKLGQKKQPECLRAYQQEAIQKAEARLCEHVTEAKRVLGNIDVNKSWSGSDYNITFENTNDRYSFPEGFRAYRDIGWKPCKPFIQGIMEGGPVSFNMDSWCGSGGFRRDLKISEPAFRRILSHDSSDNHKSQGLLLSVVNPETGEPLIIDAHGMSEDIEVGHGTLAEFGPIMWEGDDVTKVFWARIDEMIAALDVEREKKEENGTLLRIPGKEALRLAQEEPTLNELKNLIGADTLQPYGVRSDWAYYFYLDEEWKIKRADDIRHGHTQSWGGYDPEVKNGDGWHFNIFESDRRSWSENRDFRLSEFECLMGMEGAEYDRELGDYKWQATFPSRPELEQGIHILCTSGIVNPLQLVVRGKELYIFDTINFSKIKGEGAKVARLNFSKLAIVSVNPEPKTSTRALPVPTLPEGTVTEKLTSFVHSVCPALLHPYIEVKESKGSLFLTINCPPNVKSTGLYKRLTHRAFELMKNIVQWDRELRCDIFPSNKKLGKHKGYSLKLDQSAHVNTFIAMIHRQPKLLSYLKARFLAVAMELHDDTDGIDSGALAVIHPDERSIVHAEQSLCVNLASREQLLQAARDGNDRDIPYLVSRGADSSEVLGKILETRTRGALETPPKLSTCRLLIEHGAKLNEKMLYNATSHGSLPIVKLLMEHWVKVDTEPRAFVIVFSEACYCLHLDLMSHYYEELKILVDSDKLQVILNRGLYKALFNGKGSTVEPAVRFLLAHGADLENSSNQSPAVIQLAKIINKDNRPELLTLLLDMVAMRGNEQVEKDVESYVRLKTCRNLDCLPPIGWPNPKNRWGHLFESQNDLKNFKNSNGLKQIRTLVKLGYGKQGLWAIVNDLKEREDPIAQMQLIEVQTMIVDLLLREPNDLIKRQLADGERRVLSVCLAYIFDERANFGFVEKSFLDNCVIRWEFLGLQEEALQELEKYGERAKPWIKKLQ